MDITKMSLIELKALAYDLIALGEDTTRKLQAVNNQIAQKLANVDMESPLEK